MNRLLELVVIIAGLFLLAFLIGQLFGNSETIAIIPIRGVIMPEESAGFGQNVVSSSEIVDALEKAEKNDAVKAVILEINSGGGSVVASREIVDAVKHMQKPVVAWIREVGASGAYWVASASDVVVADKLSMTGSIGVIASYLEFSGLMDEYGVSYVDLKAGKYKDIGSPFKKMTAEEQRLLEAKLKQVYDVFVEDVAHNRNLSVEHVRDAATGIYYLGEEAKALGLVDVLGFKHDAVDAAKQLANITGEPDLEVYEEQKGIFDILAQLRQSMSGSILSPAPQLRVQ